VSFNAPESRFTTAKVVNGKEIAVFHEKECIKKMVG
jgi:hypothetical protein